MSNSKEMSNYDPEALKHMFSQFPDSKKQTGKDRYLTTCPSCHIKLKYWWFHQMPHHGGCFACDAKHKSVFHLSEIGLVNYRSEFEKGYRDDLSPKDNLVMKYRADSKKNHRLSDRVLSEFRIDVKEITRSNGKGTYQNLAIGFENTLGYIKHLNFSGRWASVKSEYRDGIKWLNLHRIKPDTDTIYVLAGEWDLFSFWENTDIHGISPLDGEASPAKMSREDIEFLSNKHIVIFFDNDKAGYKGSKAFAKNIQIHHKTKSIKVVNLRRLGLEGGEDIDDFFQKGGTKERLLDEIENTPDFNGMIFDEADIELARIQNDIPRPVNKHSVIDNDEILDRLWQTATLPESKRSQVIESIIESNGIFKEKQRTIFKEEERKYRQELETMRYLAYDYLTEKSFNDYHIKKMKSFAIFESEQYYYYQDGMYNFLKESFRERIADDIARKITPPDERKELSKVRKQSTEDFNLKILDADESEFDTDKSIINFENGVYHIEKKELRDHSPDYLITHKLPIQYEPEAKCPNFIKALDTWFENEDDKTEFIKLCWYLISGIRKEEIIFWFHGGGEDGKTQAGMLLRSIVGEKRTAAIPIEDLTDKHATAPLFGKLLNIADEVDSKSKMPDAKIKRLSGNSLTTINPKNRDQITVMLKAVWVVLSNYLPISSDTSHGYFRRFKIFKFRRVPSNERVKEFFEMKLKPELPGIVNHIIEHGQKLYEKDGFKETALEGESMKQMKTKNSVYSYWQYVTDLMNDTNEEKIEEYFQKYKKELPDDEAYRKAKEQVIIDNTHDGDIDDIKPYTIIQRYEHRKDGEIYIVNTEKHYGWYKEFIKNDEVKPVAYSTFRNSTSHFIMDRYREIVYDTEFREIWKKNNLTGEKKNVGLIKLKLSK